MLVAILQQVYDKIPQEAAARTEQLRLSLRTALRKSERMWDETALIAHLNSLKDRVESIPEWDKRLLRFTNFARKYSEGPKGFNGGDLGMLEIGSQEQAIEEELFRIEPQTVSAPFKLGKFFGALYCSPNGTTAPFAAYVKPPRKSVHCSKTPAAQPSANPWYSNCGATASSKISV